MHSLSVSVHIPSAHQLLVEARIQLFLAPPPKTFNIFETNATCKESNLAVLHIHSGVVFSNNDLAVGIGVVFKRCYCPVDFLFKKIIIQRPCTHIAATIATVKWAQEHSFAHLLSLEIFGQPNTNCNRATLKF
ncbi:hypothetical protein HYC85_010054 [Camellia sinensis]|uniref:SWIM-type domain-containing protein n=1 Tax=Camellia sinensis TaxID=4442 RepID=A0A7J7HGS5_CAMSI|nr:hypothetical protein HYC85_010054 [Camellia sinensis]